MIEQAQDCSDSKQTYPDYEAVPHQHRDSVEAEWIGRILNDLQFQCEQQHPRMEPQQDTLETQGELGETMSLLKEAPDFEGWLYKDQEISDEYEFEASEH